MATNKLMKRLAKYREDHGLTYEELAKELGVSKRTAYRWLLDGGTPQARFVERIEDVLRGAGAKKAKKAPAHTTYEYLVRVTVPEDVTWRAARDDLQVAIYNNGLPSYTIDAKVSQEPPRQDGIGVGDAISRVIREAVREEVQRALAGGLRIHVD